MKTFIALRIIGACIATPGARAAERFAADKPTPLKLLRAGKDDGTALRFGGSVQLAGQFSMLWQIKDDKPIYRRITFFPDAASAALLPRPVGDKAVAELLLANPEQAGTMLRDLATVETKVPREQIVSHGAATITIRDYRTAVDCDHRWYLAELMSAVRKDIVVGARDAHPAC